MARVVMAALVLCALLYVVTSLFWPLGWDHGILGWVGATVSAGGLPFVDAWDTKGPASYLPFALVSLLAGPTAVGYRILDLVLLGAGAVAVAGIVREQRYPKAALAAGLGLIGVQADFGYKDTLQPDHWAGWMIAGAICLALRPRPGRRWALAGALIGLTVLIKPHFGLFGLLPLAIAWRGGHERRSALLPFVVGALLPIGLCSAWLFVRGGLHQAIEGYLLANVDALLDPGGSVGLGGGIRRIVADLPVLAPLCLAAPVGVWILWHEQRGNAVLLGSWLALGIAGLVSQDRWYPYHAAPLMPPLLVLGTIGLVGIWNERGRKLDRTRSRSGVLTAVVVSSIAIGLLARPVVSEAVWVSRWLLGRQDRRAYLARFDFPRLNFAPAELEAAVEYIKRVTTPDQCVLSWPEPGVNLLAGRATPSRFAAVSALTRYRTAPRWQTHRTEFLEAMDRNQPALVLVDTISINGASRYVGDLTRRFPELVDHLRRQYDSVGSVGKYVVWRPRRTPSGPCPRAGLSGRR